jgi:hypothetical protein
VDGRIILKTDLKEIGCQGVNRIQLLRIISSERVKDGEFVDHMSDYQLLNQDSAVWS